MGPGLPKQAQSALDVSYNSVADYARSIRIGLTESYPDYAAIRPEKDQQHPQLNDAVLQIENEFYGTIRPKRTTRSGERPLAALNERGVEYVEVRCLISTFRTLGINAEQIRFLDTFLLLCLLAPPPRFPESRVSVAEIRLAWSSAGREPGLQLETDTGLVALAISPGNCLRRATPSSEPWIEQRERRERLQFFVRRSDRHLRPACKRKRKSQPSCHDTICKGDRCNGHAWLFFKFTMHQQEISGICRHACDAGSNRGTAKSPQTLASPSRSRGC